MEEEEAYEGTDSVDDLEEETLVEAVLMMGVEVEVGVTLPFGVVLTTEDR